MIYKSISDVARYQRETYQFPVVEPIFTVLTEPGACSDRELYNLSLQYEPRESANHQTSNTGSFGIFLFVFFYL